MKLTKKLCDQFFRPLPNQPCENFPTRTFRNKKNKSKILIVDIHFFRLSTVNRNKARKEKELLLLVFLIAEFKF